MRAVRLALVRVRVWFYTLQSPTKLPSVDVTLTLICDIKQATFYYYLVIRLEITLLLYPSVLSRVSSAVVLLTLTTRPFKRTENETLVGFYGEQRMVEWSFLS